MNKMIKKVYINDIIINSANAALSIQNNDGSFPCGHNGPWNNIDTPVRTTSHWAILLLKAFNLTNKTIFSTSALKAYNYLFSKDARPYNYAFHCIKSSEKKMHSNGLIGQAWVIESLLEGYECLKNSNYLKIAEDLILKHNFNKDLCLWNILGLKGEILNLHKTFNQQLWFSVLAFKVAKMCNNNEILIKTDKFFKVLPSIIKFNKFIRMHISEKYYQKDHNFLNHSFRKLKYLLVKPYFLTISRGYLAFSLLALSELFTIDKYMNIWKNNELKKIIIESVKYLDERIFNDDKNKFGFQYNPIGFEVASIKEKLSEYLEYDNGYNIEEWILKQINNHYDFNNMLMIRNTSDPNTLASRVYEMTKLENRLISI